MTDCFANILRRHRRVRPDAPALTFEGRTQSFAALDAASSRIANLLAAKGVGAGGRVAILSRNRAEFFETIYAANKIGATLVCLNWRLSPREIGQILQDAEPALLLVDETGAGLLPEGVDGCEVLRFGAAFDALRDDQPATDPGHAGAPGDTALILYTSGTTGLPKGVMLTNEGMSYSARLAEDWGMTDRRLRTYHSDSSPALSARSGQGSGSPDGAPCPSS